MLSTKSLLLFLSGCGAGIVITAALLNPGARVHASVLNTGPYQDVPASHAAAYAVASLKAKGIVIGYADNTYRGVQPVTRYELAVTLARFAKYYDTSKAPISTSSVPLPTAPAWATPSREYLASNAFLPATSSLFKDPGTHLVTADDFVDSISSVLDRLSDRSLPPAVK